MKKSFCCCCCLFVFVFLEWYVKEMIAIYHINLTLTLHKIWSLLSNFSFYHIQMCISSLKKKVGDDTFFMINNTTFFLLISLFLRFGLFVYILLTWTKLKLSRSSLLFLWLLCKAKVSKLRTDKKCNCNQPFQNVNTWRGEIWC